MRLPNLMMSVLSMGSLVLMGCPGDDGSVNETSAASSGTTSDDPDPSTGPGNTTEVDPTAATVDDTAAESTGPEPLPEFDCEGADGVLDGNVQIQSAADLAQLDGIREVTRSVVIDSTDLTDLDALGCLQRVGENLQVFGNDSLTNVDGLVSLTEVTGNLIFTENAAITDFDGLQSLTKVDGSFSMNSNDAMTQVSGFDSLVGIEGNITVRDNPVLLNIDGLKGLMVVNGVLAITANPMLCQSSVNCVGSGIVVPPVPPDTWSTSANNDGC